MEGHWLEAEVRAELAEQPLVGALGQALADEAIELDEGLRLDDVVLFTEVILEEVIGRGLGVEAEPDRTHHHYGVW
jgi:hypothetical protein